MKLRNKKTGEIGDLMGSERSCPFIIIDIDFHDGNPRAFDYASLAELNEDWEDYKPTEPLIKDPEIREAVRAWAKVVITRESDGIKKVFYEADEWELNFREIGWARFQLNQPLGLGLDDEEYTITELCGKEEE